MGVGRVLKLGLVVDMRTRVWMGVGQQGAVPMELTIDRLVENCVGAHVLTVRRFGGCAKHVGLRQIGVGSRGHNPRGVEADSTTVEANAAGRGAPVRVSGGRTLRGLVRYFLKLGSSGFG